MRAPKRTCCSNYSDYYASPFDEFLWGIKGCSYKDCSEINCNDLISVHFGDLKPSKFKAPYVKILESSSTSHLYNPIKAIEQCFKIQKIDQKILVEIPLFEQVQNYSVGAFQIEHLHYFSEDRA